MSDINNIENNTETAENTTTNDFQFLGDPTADKPAAAVSKPLIKKLMPVFVLLVSAVVLFAAAFTIKMLNPADPVDDDTEDTTIEIFNFTGTSAERLDVVNQNDTYSFVRNLEKTYYIENHEECPVTNSSIISLLTYFGSLKAETEVATDVTDFEQFGLASPVSKVTWTKGDKQHVVEIGDLAPSGNYYMRVDGGSTVYTLAADAAKLFFSPRMDFYPPDVYDFEEKSDAPYINYMSIKPKDKDLIEFKLQDLADESIDSAYIITNPVQHNMSVEKSSLFTSMLGNLSSLTVYDDDLSKENLKQYGLDNPRLTFTFVNVAEKHVLHIGNSTESGYSYLYAEDKPFVYIVDDSTINLLTYDVEDYCEAMSYLRSYSTVDSLTISGGGKTYEIDITGSSEKDDLKAYINNKYVPYDSFADLYGHIIGIQIKDTIENKKLDDLIVTITVKCLDGSTDVLKYYRQNETDTYFDVNGKGMFVLPTAACEQIIEFSQKLYDGEQIISEW